MSFKLITFILYCIKMLHLKNVIKTVFIKKTANLKGITILFFNFSMGFLFSFYENVLNTYVIELFFLFWGIY